jgi:hypothetical protein
MYNIGFITALGVTSPTHYYNPIIID